MYHVSLIDKENGMSYNWDADTPRKIRSYMVGRYDFMSPDSRVEFNVYDNDDTIVYEDKGTYEEVAKRLDSSYLTDRRDAYWDVQHRYEKGRGIRYNDTGVSVQ
jgi:hypothetical protein